MNIGDSYSFIHKFTTYTLDRLSVKINLVDALKIIGLLTDFGNKDPYVAIMKAVILGINPSVNIVDISHDVRKFSITEASFMLNVTYRYFPVNTIFTVVIDPGVGSTRRALAVKTSHYIFIGPDNGVLIPAIIDDGVVEIREITNENFMLKPISKTFHGRDVFAISAAYISLGVPLSFLGPKIRLDDLVKVKLAQPIIWDKRAIGCFMYFDSFGNASTNIEIRKVPWLSYGDKVRLTIRDKEIIETIFGKTFSDVKEDEPILLVNSFGFLELAVNKGSAQGKYNLKYKDKVVIERVEQ